jgi:hypothetical protein
MARQVVGNPFENQIGTVSATATPVDIYQRGVVKRSPFEALANTLSNLEQKASPILERERQRLAQKEFAEGSRLYEENRIALGEAVKSGLIEEGESPYLKKGYRASQMSTMAMRYTSELETALERQKLYTNDDPARIEKFIAKFQGDFMKSNGMDEFADHEVSEYFGQAANKGNELFRASWRSKHVAFPREYLSKASKSFANFKGSARKSALVLKSFFSKFLTSTAGLPAKTELGGTSFVTTAPAPIILFLPILTPLQMIALSPIQTLSSNTTGFVLPTGFALS